MSKDAGSKVADPPESPAKRVRLGMPQWWFPMERLPRWLLPAVGAGVLLTFMAGAMLAYALGWFEEEAMEDLGYIGIFVTNFVPHALLFSPLPATTVLGQVLIVTGAAALNPVIVASVATVAMTLADCTAYIAGRLGRTAAEGRKLPDNVFGRAFGKMAGGVNRMMDRAGFITLVILSGVPNPIYEVAGITAGAVRMNFFLFVLAVGLGNLIRVALLVLLGTAALELLRITD